MGHRLLIVNTLMALLCITSLVGQSRLQNKADDLFIQFSYSKAIPLYKQMLETHDNETHALQRLSEAYLLIRDFEKSIPYFERFIENEETPSSYYFKYGMALKSVGNEKEALHWLKRYKKLNKNDERVKQFLNDGNLASVVFNSEDNYEVKPVPFNSEYNDFGALVFDNRIYFSSSRPRTDQITENYEWDDQPWLDIYYIEAGRNPFSTKQTDYLVKPIEGDINTEYHESSLSFSTDYKNDTIVYFTRNNFFEEKKSFFKKEHKDEKLIEKQNNLKIFRGEKQGEAWKVTRNLTINADHYSTGHPSVNRNRSKLYFASDRPGGYGGTDIYYCEIHPRGGVYRPINAGPIVNTPGNEMFPFVNNEGKLFFSSDGHVGFGQLDIFTTVSNEDQEIVNIINLGKPLNSEKDDFAFFSNENGTRGFISSNRDGGKGGDDIYRFNFTPSLYVDGYVFDAVNDQPLDSVVVKLTKKNSDVYIKETMTDEKGYYKMFLNRNALYTLSLERRTHPNRKINLNTFNLEITQEKLTSDISMEPVLDVKILSGFNKIYYDFGKSNIRPDAAKELDKVIDLMVNTYPFMTIRIEAHTDPSDSDKENDALSKARATATYEYLINNGIAKERIISYEGFGDRRPVNDCKSRWDCKPELLEQNRRTEFPIVTIFSPKSQKALSENRALNNQKVIQK